MFERTTQDYKGKNVSREMDGPLPDYAISYPLNVQGIKKSDPPPNNGFDLFLDVY